jgi:hypothetical protein
LDAGWGEPDEEGNDMKLQSATSGWAALRRAAGMAESGGDGLPGDVHEAGPANRYFNHVASTLKQS